MRLPLLTALLYAAMTFGANPVFADGSDAVKLQAILDMRIDDMRKLKVHNAPLDVVEIGFEDADGNVLTFADSTGRFRLVNFWATWCAPCREEMPSLDALNIEMGNDLQVLTIATGRNRMEGILDFYAETGLQSLPILLDPRGQLARGMGVIGLPVTIVLDAEGREVARLTGGADWSSQNAKGVLTAIMDR